MRKLLASVFWFVIAAAASLATGACAPDRADDLIPSPRPARRVVSLAPAFTETLIALGAAEVLVGTERYGPDVPGRPGLPRLGDAMGVDLEALTALEPDLVLVNARVLADRLAPVARRVRVVELPTDRLDEALDATTEIARLVGREDEGIAIVARCRAALDASRARAGARRARGEKAPRVLVVVQRRPFYTAGAGSFVDDLLRAVGAENVFGDVAQPWPAVSEESIVARAPEVVLDASVGDVDTAEGRAALAREWERYPTLPAVRAGRVRVIREDAIFRAGPRIPEALGVLERLVFDDEGVK